jgi:hypothetical protein
MKQTGKATRERQKFNPWTPRALVGHCQNLMDGSEIVVELSPPACTSPGRTLVDRDSNANTDAFICGESVFLNSFSHSPSWQ